MGLLRTPMPPLRVLATDRYAVLPPSINENGILV